MTIHCHDLESFMNAVYQCTARGLRFDAYTETLKIILTGGH